VLGRDPSQRTGMAADQSWCRRFRAAYAEHRAAEGRAVEDEELRRLRGEVGPDHVWFADDIFGLTPSWIEAFAREVTRDRARTRS
jgi:hypothetical protein